MDVSFVVEKSVRMSTSAHWLRAMYLAQAVATRVDSVPAAAIVEPASDEAWAVGSREIPMSTIVPGVVGNNARAGIVSWRWWRRRRGASWMAM